MLDIALQRSLFGAGFDDKESRAYLALLELGSGTVTQIAKKAELKRAIVYHVLSRLQERGYVQEMENKKVKRFQATDPSKIVKNIITAADDLRVMLPVLRAVQHKGYSKPRVEFFESKEAIVNIYRTYDRGESMRFLTSIRRLHEFIPEEVEQWVKRFESGVIKSGGKHLVVDCKEDRSWGQRVKKYNQDIRLLPKGQRVDMDFAIVDDMLGITSFDPLFIVVIYSESVARSAEQFFDLAWKSGRVL